MNTLIPHRVAIAAILIICALAAIFKLGHIGTTFNSDYTSYIETARLFSGQPTAALHPERVLKPLAPVVVAAIAPFSGYSTAFLIEVVFFYLAFALVLYSLAWFFFEDRWLAFIAALLGALSYPILRYGVDLYTETGAQFFYVLSLVLTLLFIKRPSRKLLIANGLALGIGLLWKEYSVVAGLIFGLILLLQNISWRVRIADLALLALISLTPTLLVQLWVYFAYHYTYFNWYLAGGASGFATQFTAHNIIKSVAALLGLAWLFVPFGFRRFRELSVSQKKFLYYVIPASMVALLWGYVSSRLFYVMAPAFILLAVFGISKTPRWIQICALIFTVAANLIWLMLAVSGVSA
ncbi:MAG: hypothetical protein ACYC75_02720 [Minisyncoccota bacterium]